MQMQAARRRKPSAPAPRKRYRGERGPQVAPTKVQITIRLDATVIAWYRGTGDGWQTRFNHDLVHAHQRRLSRKVGS